MSVCVDADETRTGYFPSITDTPADALGKDGFPGSQFSDYDNNFTSLDTSSETNAKLYRLFR